METLQVRTALARLVARWRDYRAAVAAVRELEETDPDTIAAIAAECGLTMREFREVVRNGSGAESLMARMMAAFDLDPVHLRATVPAMMREVEALCSRCTAKGRCARELGAGTAALHAGAFCPNAETFARLV